MFQAQIFQNLEFLVFIIIDVETITIINSFVVQLSIVKVFSIFKKIDLVYVSHSCWKIFTDLIWLYRTIIFFFFDICQYKLLFNNFSFDDLRDIFYNLNLWINCKRISHRFNYINYIHNFDVKHVTTLNKTIIKHDNLRHFLVYLFDYI